MNLIRLAELLAGEKAQPVTLVATHCLHHRDRLQECRRCYDVCPAEAIAFDGKPTPSLATEACQRCLACLPACPSGAITAPDELGDLLNYLEGTDMTRVELLCQLHPAAERGLPGRVGLRVRGCLAGLGAGALLLLAAAGYDIVLRDDACAECVWQPAAAALARQIGEARRFLALWERAELVRASGSVGAGASRRPLHRTASPPLSRRALFSAPAQSEKDEQVDPGGEHPFRERLRLVRAVQQLSSPPAGAREIPLPLLDLATVAVGANCNACGACSRLCPTGALALEQDDERYRLTFAPLACIGCAMCAHVCVPEAVTVERAPTFDQIFGEAAPRLLREGPLARCKRCRAHFPAEAGREYCDLCEFRRRNPFGAMPPPGRAAQPADKAGDSLRKVLT